METLEKVEPGIYKRLAANGSTRFKIGWRDAGGKQRWRYVDGGITAARAARSVELARRAKGEKIAADPRLKFDAAADAWWDARAVKLRTTTQSAYKASLTHLRQTFGSRRLSDITPADVAAYVSAKQGEGLKGWTIKGQLSVLSAVFVYSARHLGLIGINPVAVLDRVERPSTDDEKAKRILTDAELSRLLAAVDDYYRPLFTLAARTGARLAEVLGLTWQDIDLDGGAVTFTDQLDRKGKRAPLKTKRSRRTIEIPPGLVSMMRAAKVASGLTTPHDLVFLSRKGTGHDHRNVAGRVLARAVKRAGLEAIERDGQVIEPAPTFHDLRHSHASSLIAAGWDIEEVSARLGHASVATTMRVYTHEFDKAGRSAQRHSRLAAMEAASLEAFLGAPDGSKRPADGSNGSASVAKVQQIRA
ncbi:MAG TPA: site-specific integrase [Solirubrobacteraceae bacterium]|nr:site-specific integrase [Solirubrobacteraceae bacterium]